MLQSDTSVKEDNKYASSSDYPFFMELVYGIILACSRAEEGIC